MKNKRQEVMQIMSRINRKLFTANGNREGLFMGRGQINVLKEIINNQGITQDELANILNIDKTTVAKAVKRLEAQGLIVRNRSETDLRKKELVATEKALTVKEHMTKHMEDIAQAFFEGITEEEIDMFKDILEKIELNVERRRKIMNDKKHVAMKVLKLIEENGGIDLTKLGELLNKDTEKVKKIVEKLINMELLEEENGLLKVTQNAKEFRKEHIMDNREDGKRKVHKEHGEIFKLILKNNGLSKDELVEKSGKSTEQIDSLLKHFESKGVVEVKEGKLYANKEALKEHHKNHRHHRL